MGNAVPRFSSSDLKFSPHPHKSDESQELYPNHCMDFPVSIRVLYNRPDQNCLYYQLSIYTASKYTLESLYVYLDMGIDSDGSSPCGLWASSELGPVNMSCRHSIICMIYSAWFVHLGHRVAPTASLKFCHMIWAVTVPGTASKLWLSVSAFFRCCHGP